MKTVNMAAAAAFACAFAPLASAALINEFQPNPTGGDPSTVQIELLGTAGASFSGVLLSIESDSSSSLGTIDRLSTISGTFDSNGLLVADIDDLENPSFTMILLDSFSGALGDDIDLNDDGVADNLGGFGTVLDAIGVPDEVGDEAAVYGAQLGGADFAYTGDEPQLIFRDRVTQTWFAINDPAGTDAIDLDGNLVSFGSFDADPSVTTFGAINPTASPVPVPAALWLFGSALGLLGLRGRRNA